MGDFPKFGHKLLRLDLPLFANLRVEDPFSQIWLRVEDPFLQIWSQSDHNCDRICEKGSSTHIQFTNFDDL